VRVGLLGSVEVWDGAGCLVEVSGARLRALLALLALRPGQVAGVGYLIDELWESRPPDGAANALQALVSRLRRALPDGVVASRPGGYQLAVERDQVDVFRFERLAGQGRALLAAGDPASAGPTLREALALWRGPAFADAGESGTVRATVVRLDELRLAATEARIEADLRLGAAGPRRGWSPSWRGGRWGRLSCRRIGRWHRISSRRSVRRPAGQRRARRPRGRGSGRMRRWRCLRSGLGR